MRRIACICCAVGFSVSLASAGTNGVSEADLVGRYYEGDGLGVNVYINIQSNGTFDCLWRGCLGVYGTSTGSWSFATNRLVLRPTEETDMLRDYPLREFDVQSTRDSVPLLMLQNSNSFFEGQGFLKKTNKVTRTNKPTVP